MLSLLCSSFVGPSANAKTIGAFKVGKCEKGVCQILEPRSGQTFESNSNLSELKRSEFKRANQWYRSIAQADKILTKRGFPDTARVALIYSFFSRNYSRYREIATDVYLRRVHGNTVDQVGGLSTAHVLAVLIQYGLHYKTQYHVITGKRLPITSPVAVAKTIPKCYRNSKPYRDCRPIRYDPVRGCLLTKKQSSHLASNEWAWKEDGLADLPAVPVKNKKSRIDLASAKRTQAKKAGKKKKVAKARDPNNPAGRALCSSN